MADEPRVLRVEQGDGEPTILCCVRREEGGELRLEATEGVSPYIGRGVWVLLRDNLRAMGPAGGSASW